MSLFIEMMIIEIIWSFICVLGIILSIYMLVVVINNYSFSDLYKVFFVFINIIKWLFMVDR